MTLPRTFVVEIIDDQDVTHHLRIKGTDDMKVMKDVDREYPDCSIIVCRALQKHKREEKRYASKPIFPINPFRAGRFIYRHKGKKKRGRKNYPAPNGGFARRGGCINFTWVEHYSTPVREFLQRWVEELTPPGAEVNGLIAQKGEEYPVIVLDSLAFLDENPPAKMTIPFDIPAGFIGEELRGMTPKEAAEVLNAVVAKTDSAYVFPADVPDRRPPLSYIRDLVGER